MQRHIRSLWFGTLLLVSCGAAPEWQVACGCSTAINEAAQELGITTLPDDGLLDAKVLVAKLDEYFSRPKAAAETIEIVRALGPFHNHACYQVKRDLVRCHYWFWNAANYNQRRGVQVDVKGGVAGTPKGWSTSYKYVEEAE